jgi:REP-associated tyrosine transposase
MARPLRIEFSGALYHVTARGNERKATFRDDEDRAAFLERLAEVVRKQRLVVHAYVLMRNHYHLLVETQEANLSRAMRQLGGVYTQDFNRRHDRTGHLFQGRFKAILVEKDSYLLELSRYIHLNPVRVGEVAKPWQFAWSSARAYVGRVAEPAFLSTAAVLSLFGKRRAAAQQKYGEFLLEGIGKAERKPWASVEGQVLLGGKRWVERMKRRIADRDLLHEEAPRAKGLRARPSVSVVVTQVCREAGLKKADVLRRRGDRGGWARQAAMALAAEVCGLSQREIGREFGVGAYAVSKAQAKVAELEAGGGKVGRKIERLKSSFQT